jgi:2,3-bisphosphoglycerate-dependent phosphoglycerate mutase
LTEEGRRQAGVLHDRLRATGELAAASCLVSSVLPRAVETAETIAPAVGRGDLETGRDCGLCELHPGKADGLTEVELEARFGRPDWRRDPATPIAPDGESLVSFFVRATRALLRLVEAHPGEMVAAVTHGGVVEAAMVGFLGLRFEAGAIGLDPAPCSMTWWSYDGERRPPRWRLERYNDAAHLLWRHSTEPVHEEDTYEARPLSKPAS